MLGDVLFYGIALFAIVVGAMYIRLKRKYEALEEIVNKMQRKANHLAKL